MKEVLINTVLVILCAIFWRMGGAAGYNKLWRRIGSTVCMGVILWPTLLFHLLSLPLLLWGCSSYFGWINRFIDVQDKEREYWWNFWAQNFVIQSTVLFFDHSIENIIFVICSSLFIAIVKVWTDNNMTKADVKSELWHGGANAAALWINALI